MSVYDELLKKWKNLKAFWEQHPYMSEEEKDRAVAQADEVIEMFEKTRQQELALKKLL